MRGMLKNETPEQRRERMKNLGRKGGTNKKGSRHVTTVDREQILEQIKNTVALRAKTLINVQTMLAVGTVKVFKIETTRDEKGRETKSRPELVTDDETIIDALDYEYGDGENPSDDETYYFVTTKDPDNKALDSLIDRTFGKAKESKEIKHTGLSLKDLHAQAIAETDDE